MYKPTSKEKEIFRKRIIKGAQQFDKYLLNKKFIVVTIDYKVFQIVFNKKEFLHLTGLSVNIGENLFYKLCKEGKISNNNISNFQRHNKNTLMTKTTNIEKIIKFIYADASTNLILKDFIMKSIPNRPFPCAIENPSENMVLAFTNSNNVILKAKSLRKKTNNEIYSSSHLILGIFSQEKQDSLADSIVYIKNVQSLLLCPNINDYVKANLINKLKSASNNINHKKAKK